MRHWWPWGREAERLRRERSQLARDLAAAESRLTSLHRQRVALGQAMLEAVVSVDAERRVTHASEGARALFDAGDEAIGKSLIEFSWSNELNQLAADALASGAVRDELDRQIAIGGRPFRARAAAFEGGVVLALSDVSELQRLGRARRDFVANISHELRTPLTSVRLLLERLLSGAAIAPREAADALQKINVEVEALEQLAQELLDLAQIESGQALVRMLPVPVEELAAGAVSRLAPQAAHKRQTVNMDVSPDLIVLADAEQVSRALGNLLHNAIKFTPPEGQVWVRARAEGNDILVEVADTGPGIPPDDLPRIFERFFRSDRSRAGGGTGLGLAIAKHVVEAHGGQIWAESEGRPGRGTVFRFTLPAADYPG